MHRYITCACVFLAPIPWIAGQAGNARALPASACPLGLALRRRMPAPRNT